MLWTLAILALLAPAGSFAQTRAPKSARKTPAKAAAASEWPIERLVVEGNHAYTKDQILAVAGLKVGQMAGKAEFDAAQQRLVASGAFEKVDYRFEPSKASSGYVATFGVIEGDPMYPVQFEGLPAKASEIGAWLKSKDPLYGPQMPASDVMIKRYTQLIQELLAAKKQDEKVIGRVTPTGANQFAIIFRSARPLPTVAAVKFEGNQLVPTTLLQKTISEVAYGFPYTETGMHTLLDNSIRPLYDARGLVRVTFPKITTARAANDVNGIAVTVTVNEGPEYKLGDVRITGSYAGKGAELLKVGAFKKGETANFDDVSQGLERIKRRLRRSGYMLAETRIDRAIDDKAKIVNVAIRIDEGPQFLFGALTIQGLDLNSEAGLRKLWALQPGKPYNADYPDYFLQRVREDGIFDNLHKTKSQTKVNEQAHTVDVTLQFQ